MRIQQDGPQQTSQPWEHSWIAFQGKAYPNPYNGDLACDQALADCDRERRLHKRDTVERARMPHDNVATWRGDGPRKPGAVGK